MRLLQKSIACIMSVAIVLAAVSLGCFAESAEIAYYVSATGSDSNSGTIESPFATIRAAKNAVRALRSNGAVNKNIVINIAAGTYYLPESLTFTYADSGTQTSRVTYQSYNGPVYIKGGRNIPVSDFRELTEQEKQLFPSESSKNNVLVCDLSGYNVHPAATYFEEMQTIAVNSKMINFGSYPNTGYTMLSPSLYETKRATWTSTDRIWIIGYMSNTYSCDTDRYSSNYDCPDSKVAIVNALQEVDSANEFYIDINNKKLYIYPDSDFNTSDITLSENSEGFFHGDVDNITFKGLNFSSTTGTAIKLEGDNIEIDSCEFSVISEWGISLNGYNNKVSNNKLEDLGRGGIDVRGGVLSTLKPSRSIVYNNYIEDFAKLVKTYEPAVQANGCGILISHNEMYNTAHEAIEYGGADIIIEYNEIGNVCLETGDSGAIYAGRHWTWNNCIIRYNYIHNVGRDMGGPSAIYWDDALSGQIAYGNVIYYTFNKGFHIGGGFNNKVYNNLLIDTGEEAISYDCRAAVGQWGHGLALYTSSPNWRDLNTMPYMSTLWQTRFGVLSLLKETMNISPSDMDAPGNTAYSVFKDNVFCKCKNAFYTGNTYMYKMCTIKNNLTIKSIAEAGFVDSANKNFALKDDSCVYYYLDGFKKIPFDLIGNVA